MKIQITENIKEHASLITKHKNFGNRAAGFNGNTQKQTTGIIGELIIYKVLGLPFPTYKDFSPSDIDINGNKIDIKTRRSSNSFMRPGWVHNLVGHQLSHLVPFVLFNNYNAGASMMEIDGWLPKQTILDNRNKWAKAEGSSSQRDDGTRLTMQTNNIEIPTEAVIKINTVEDINNIGKKI
ncbi:MAG: hypothetical protein HN702_04560 [Flavobacteriales bacterium]|nr:hypothetical protein [Flavobacteriales bacterium]